MGVANDPSIAGGIVQALHRQGADLAFTYQGAAFERRVRPLAASAGSSLVLPCEVEQDSEVAATFAALGETWGSIDFVVHAIAYSDKEELKGRYLNTSRANFRRTLAISCYSFTAVAREARPLMTQGGSLIPLTSLGDRKSTRLNSSNYI